MLKGISPLIAEVLLIGFTVAVASIVILWVTGFTKSSTKTIGSQAETQMACTYGGIEFYSDVIYNSSSSILSGYLRNTGNIPLGNISFQVTYNNGTISSFSNQISEILPNNIASFSLSGISSNYDTIYVSTNCTNPPVSTKISASEIKVVS
ncbi:MAG: archaellin/type IV pilin N-terminal domain-containing protein [Candidatus Aenigmatarchaeota archaeon]